MGRPTVEKLLGVVAKLGADDGVFVSWSRFKSKVWKGAPPAFLVLGYGVKRSFWKPFLITWLIWMRT